MRARRVPEVTQFAQSECGLCCVAMILSAYGSRNSVSALRRRHETGRDGLSIAEIVSILQGYGMRVRTFRASTEGLRRLTCPLMVYWDHGHLVVLEKVTDRYASVVDPAGGRRKYRIEEFEQHYGGLAIEATPTSAYEPVRHREPSVWREFLRATGTARRQLALAFAMSLLLYSFTLLMPIAIQFAINRYADVFDKTPPAMLIAMLVVPMVAYLAISLTRTVCLSSVIRRLGQEMMGKTFGTLLELPYKYFASRSQGELLYRLSSIAAVRDMISSQVPTVLLDVGSLVVAFAYIFSRSVFLGLTVSILFVCMAAVAVTTYRPIRRIIDREISETAKSSTIQMEALASIETLKVSGMTRSFFDDWKQTYATALRQTQRRIILQGTVSSGYALFQMFGPLLVLVIGLWLVLQGSMDLGSAVAVQALAATSLGTVMSLSGSFTQLITANAQVSRVADILNQSVPPDTSGKRHVALRGAIRLRDVSFTYPGAKAPVLEGVSFDVPAGGRVAIVGSSGSGKSTLGKLLMGLYPVTSGEIGYDGVPLGDVDRDSFYKKIAYVPQEIVLSNRAIAENIGFGLPDADMDLIREVAGQAQIHRDVEAMPLGYATQVREMGGSLSGGQRQRIALARALARRPRVLILDEATSALDTVTESIIADALDDLECTRVIIAHRLSTIVKADLIVVLQEGRVVQTGRHDELVAVPGPYQGLVRAQVDVSGV
ncbi:peptidase domain-containing ABC transporter [Microbispora rosea]|uniref:peptidase domain-containing ABC transporter n=1 Tax=Microbispora rosea TaxID=58117 RepID=UPI00344A9CD8